ncbi:MAG: Hsp20 family protein [Candidatus Bathyarchaeota archaeon]|nr:Hsp20 family protein [Candidatus Bathyarchaeota archaeon]
MDKGEKKDTDIFSFFNVEILGLNLGKLLKEWVEDPEALLDPKRLEEVKRRIEEKRREFERLKEELQAKTKGVVKLDYDVRIRTLDGSELKLGSTRTEPKLIRPKIRAEEPREPLYDILDRGDCIEVVIEVPGVDERELQIDVREDSLTLKTGEDSERKYALEVKLPVRIIKEELKRTFRNGVLILTLKKQKS